MSASFRLPRFLCPALTRGVRAQRPSSGLRNEPLVQNIAKLEAYITELRKDVRKRASRAKVVKQEQAIEEQDIDELYQSLEAPARQSLPSPPSALLPPSLCSKLSIDARSSRDSVDWNLAVDTLLQDMATQPLHTNDINTILAAMPHASRIQAGRRLFDGIGNRAGRLTYDLLMDSYASHGKADQALEMFDASKAAGYKPSLYSYAHLMKAFTVSKELPKALALYRHMQEQSIEPNLVINTSLIGACIKSGKIDWAFSTFDALKYKSKATAPDAQLYSLMIHACSLDRKLSAERAADLFSEMTERGLKPTRETFNALLHVYAQRSDYYGEAWKLSDLMRQNHVEMDKTTWHSLLTACATNRDIARARNLVREMMKLSLKDKRWTPDAITYQLLFRAYAHAKVRKSLTALNVVNVSQELQESQTSDLWVDEEPFSSNALLQESAQVLQYIKHVQPQLLSTQLIDTYMTIAHPFGALERFKQDWNSLYREHEKNRHSYQVALSASYHFKDWDLLQQVWTEREAWRAQQDRARPIHSSPLKAPDDDFGDFEAVRTYIESLARQNRIQQASHVLASARRKFTFEKRHLKCFQTKSIQVEDEEAVMLYMEMFPDPQDGRMHQRRWY